jgi:maleate isomerase
LHYQGINQAPFQARLFQLLSDTEIMTQRTLIGMLTPSSNTTLEPVTSAMLSDLPEVSAHFGRFRVTEIALSERALAQFEDEEILAAASLLADAKLDVIGWNGTS